MRVVALIILSGLLVTSAALADAPAVASVAAEAELRAMATAHGAAVEAKNVDAILEFYAPDLITIPAGEPIRRGREWIRSSVNELFRTYEFHETFNFIDIRVYGDRAVASYEASQRMIPLTGGGEPVSVSAKGLCVLKRSAAHNWQFEWNAWSYDTSKPEAKK